jgi:hypothetical protein
LKSVRRVGAPDTLTVGQGGGTHMSVDHVVGQHS